LIDIHHDIVTFGKGMAYAARFRAMLEDFQVRHLFDIAHSKDRLSSVHSRSIDSARSV